MAEQGASARTDQDERVLIDGCRRRTPSALETFDALLRAQVRRAVQPFAAQGIAVDEVTQQLRERLLVPDASGRIRLEDFQGRGSLGAWLRTIAVRTALDAREPLAREDLVEVAPDAPLADPDPELALLRARYQQDFRAAFTEALAALSARDRTLLRLTTLDGLSLAQVGRMYGKDTSTVSRWLGSLRTVLLEKTRQLLAGRLALSDSALDSLMRAAPSALSLHLSRVLVEEE